MSNDNKIQAEFIQQNDTNEYFPVKYKKHCYYCLSDYETHGKDSKFCSYRCAAEKYGVSRSDIENHFCDNEK